MIMIAAVLLQLNERGGGLVRTHPQLLNHGFLKFLVVCSVHYCSWPLGNLALLLSGSIYTQ